MTTSADTPLPAYLQIEPVGQCNLRCTMCAIQFRTDGPPFGPPAFMPFDEFTQLLDQFQGVETLQLQGLGEPMMHPRFFDMVRYAAGKGIRVTTNSNMTLLNDRRARLCIESGLDCLHASIDAATPETYERIRVRAHFDRVVANLARLNAAKTRAGSLLPRIHLVVVIMRQNLDELPSLVRFAHDWSMEEVFVQHLAHDFAESQLPSIYEPMRQYVETQSLIGEDPERIEETFDDARKVAEALGIRLRLPRLDPRPGDQPHQETRCQWPWSGAYISYDGQSMPCCMVSTPDRLSLGNVAQEGVSAVWNGEAYNDFRSALLSDEPPEICRSCGIYNGTF